MDEAKAERSRRCAHWKDTLLVLSLFAGGIALIAFQIKRFLNDPAYPRVCQSININDSKIELDRDHCGVESEAHKKNNWSELTRAGSFCEFDHTNVGHKHTRNLSAIHACFPAIPTSHEIKIPCPSNSSAYFYDTTTQMISRVCHDNGTWGDHVGHCGCYYNFDKWDKITYFYKVFSNLKTVISIYSTTNLLHGIFLFTFVESLRNTKNLIHLNLFWACLIYHCVILASFFSQFYFPVNENSPTEHVHSFKWLIYCRFKDSMTVFSMLAIYTWISIECLYLYSLTSRHNAPFSSAPDVKYLQGAREAYFYYFRKLSFEPLKILANFYYRSNHAACWSSANDDPELRWMIWIYELPKKIFLINATIFLTLFQRIIWHKLTYAGTMTGASKDDADEYRHQFWRATVMLMLVYGVWDLKELFVREADLTPLSIAWWFYMYTEVGIDSLRGYFIVLLFCLSTHETQDKVKKLIHRKKYEKEIKRLAEERVSRIQRRSTRRGSIETISMSSSSSSQITAGSV